MDDLISRKAVIKETADLLKSPYAHSQFGSVSEEDAFHIRKDFAGAIVDLCVMGAIEW